MNKYKLLVCIMLLTASALAFTQPSCDEHVKLYIKADEGAGTDLADACPSNIGNNNGTRGTAGFGQPVAGDGSILFAGAQTNARVTNTTVLVSYDALTVDVIVNSTANATYGFFFSSGGNNFQFYMDNSQLLQGELRIGGTTETVTGHHVATNTVYHLALQYNGSHFSMWEEIDDVMIEITTPNAATGATAKLNDGDVFCIGSYTGDRTACDANYLTGTIDEIIVSTVARYGNNPTPFDTQAATSMTVTNLFPIDDSANNTSPTTFGYSYTAALVDEYVTDVHFYLNGSIDQTNTSVIPDTNVSSFDYTFTGSTEETVDWFIQVETNSSNLYNSTTWSFWFDDVAPLINNIVPAESASITTDLFEVSFDATDSNLFGVNVTVYNGTGNAFYNKTEYGVSSPYAFNETIDIRNHANGNYKVIIEASDDHNKLSKVIKFKPDKDDVTIDKESKKLTFINDVWDVEINGKSGETWVVVDTAWGDDKRSFTIETDNTGDAEKKYKFEVVADGLVPIESGHLAHLLKPNAYYIDFDGITGTATTKCYDDYCDVEITTTENTLNIESIGGVNVVEAVNNFTVDKTYTYSIGINPNPPFYDATVTFNATQTGTTTANAYNWTFSNGDSFTTHNATTTWTEIIGATWNFTAYFNDSSVYMANGSFNIIGMNVRVFDQTTPATELTFNITVTNATTSVTYTDRQPFAYYNLTEGIPFGSQTLKAASAGYDDGYFYTTYNANTAVVLNGYLLSTTDPNRVCPIFDVKSGGGDAIEDATITFQKQFNTSWVTVSQIQTDGAGVAQICLDSTILYRVTTAATGYDAEIDNIQPIATTYYKTLGDASDWIVYNIDDTTYAYILPLGTEITTESEVIEFILYDADARISYAELRVTNSTGENICLSTETTQPTTLTLTCDLSAGGFTLDRFVKINATGYYRLGTADTFNITRLYTPVVIGTYNQSAYTGVYDLGTQFDQATKWFLAVFLTTLAAAGISLRMGGEGAGFIALIVGGMFAFMGWFPLYLYIISAFVAVAAIFASRRGVA